MLNKQLKSSMRPPTHSHRHIQSYWYNKMTHHLYIFIEKCFLSFSLSHTHTRTYISSECLRPSKQRGRGYFSYPLPRALFLSLLLLLIKDVISACQTSDLCLSRNNDKPWCEWTLGECTTHHACISREKYSTLMSSRACRVHNMLAPV